MSTPPTTTATPGRIAMKFLMGAINGGAVGVICHIARQAPDDAIAGWGVSVEFGRNWLRFMEWTGWALGAGSLAGVLITMLAALFSYPTDEPQQRSARVRF